jgi:hypothetical protein
MTAEEILAEAQHECADCGVPTTPGVTKLGAGAEFAGEEVIQIQVTPEIQMRVTPGTWEFYRVADRVWKKAGMPKNGGGSLCVGCIEKRLKRKLVPQDFDFGPKGEGYNVPELSTPRLRSRMGR